MIDLDKYVELYRITKNIRMVNLSHDLSGLILFNHVGEYQHMFVEVVEFLMRS